jgi:transcription elongation factor Elf1
MLNWDYEFDCPKCGETYGGEVDQDSGKDKQNIKCDECGCEFIVKAQAIIDIEVEILDKEEKEY